MPESQVWVDSADDGLTLTLRIPLSRLEFAFGQPLADHPSTVLKTHGDALAQYLLMHVGARSSGQGWQALRPTLRVDGTDRAAELQALLVLRAPAGADTRRVELLFDAVTHEVRTHRAQVFLRNDWAGGQVGAAPLLLGEFSADRRSLDLSLGPSESGASFVRLFVDGAWHIADGTDHLLFLLMLLVVAPLAAASGRWSAVRSHRDALRQTAWIVTAFTCGHSVTLALGSTGLVALPVRAVEVAVAGSIAVVALHALRPLFRRGEVVLAGLFGLLHGLAFSASLSGAGLTAWQHALALLAFNLGIEIVQLGLVLLVLPLLMGLAGSRPAWYAGLRRCAAVASVLVAVVWVGQRLADEPLVAGAPGPAVASLR